VCPAVRGMHRLTATFVAALFVVAFAAAPARAGLCDLLGTCGPAIGPPAPALDPDGALHVDTPMQPLPAPAAG
jgi:hypothetical protein